MGSCCLKLQLQKLVTLPALGEPSPCQHPVGVQTTLHCSLGGAVNWWSAKAAGHMPGAEIRMDALVLLYQC